MSAPQRLFPRFVVVLAAIYVLMQVRPASIEGPYDLDAFGRIPVSAEGRVKPLDTVARNSLLIVSDRQSFRIDGEPQPAIRWLADVVARPEQARNYQVFRIDHPDVLALMGLTHDDGKRFSFERILQHANEISAQSTLANEVSPKKRTPYQRQVLELVTHLELQMRLAQLETPYLVPPLEEGQTWRPMNRLLLEDPDSLAGHPAVQAFSAMLSAYRAEDPDAFNEAVSDYRALLADRLPDATHRADFEVFLSAFQPFYHSTVLYVVAFLMACISLLLGTWSRPGWSQSLSRAAVWLLLLTFLVHTFGLVSRIYLQGRPPVTNLYSSATFIGWGGVLLALITERFYRMGLGSITAAVVGFITLIIAHNLGGDGDTMEMMQAVLDSNFWLATHVVTVTIGYSATLLAGAMAILFILMGVCTRALDPERAKTIGRMVYGVICFAALLSFVGTVLGGIWADQSWGRFWGWDPKENGAVLIVLMNVLILHARWGGMVRERGIMVLAVGGNIVTAWSWFGTNLLGVGLHSYGFMDSAVFWLLAFVGSQVVLMGLGLLPLHWWRSFAATSRPPISPAEPPGA